LNRRIAAYVFFLALLIAVRFSIVPAQAQSTYWIGTEGVLWSDPRIQINMPSSPSVLAEDLPQAMVIWNQAIKWFESTYYPLDESYYSFISSVNGAGVTIQAVDLQTLQSLCSGSTSTTIACGHYMVNSDSGFIVSAYVEILASDLTATNPAHLLAVVIALGTLLGLIEYSTPCPFSTDLMCGSSSILYPSTLDLYAVHLLANGKRATTVTLPGNIPYQQAPIVPTPEFNGTSILLLVLTASSTLILLRKKSSYSPKKFDKNQS
jgi:hypothetical protein